jgi:Dyp-type peroxidase family
MFEFKYYEGVRAAQDAQRPISELPRFDLGRLRPPNVIARIFSWLLENRSVHAVLRRCCPMLQLGRWLLVSKNDDVREILERQEEFETPYGMEMKEIARGANFILGMRDGAAYRQMKSAVLSAFPVEEVETVVRPIASRHSKDIMLKAAPGFDVVRDLLTVVPVRICRDYFGIIVEDESRFADWSIAVSALLFSDPRGNAVTREVALVAADHLIKAIDRSVDAVREGQAGNTPLARLVAMHHRNPLQFTMDEVHSIMVGMITGFVPTNVLASGNCLNEILSRPAAQKIVEEAVAASDGEKLDRAIREAMRFRPIWPGPFRYTTRDTVIAKGTRRERIVRANTIVMPLTLSAMFDPEAVRRPSLFDIGRPYRDYLVFGHGIHLCIGSAIARVQIAECFQALFSKRSVRRARGRPGRMTRIASYPRSLKIDFEPSPLSRTVSQAMVTAVWKIVPGVSLHALRERIAKLGNPACDGIRAELDSSGIIHFASLAVAGKADPAKERPGEQAHLVLELSGDGDDSMVIKAFADRIEPFARGIFEEACGLGPGKSLQSFIREHTLKISPHFGSIAGLVFSGTPGLSVARIHAEAGLAEKAQAVVDELRDGKGWGPNAILAEVRRRLKTDEHYDWAFAPAETLLEGPAGSWRQAVWMTLTAPGILTPLTMLLFACWWATYTFVFGYKPDFFRDLLVAGTSLVLTTIGLAAIAGALIGLGYLWLRRLEERDVPSDEQIDLNRFEDIVSREDSGAQNHLTAISIVKPGMLRKLTLRLAFLVISVMTKKVFRPGHLRDINTIHFARWVFLPRTNKLMFFSNYGGSWQSYLEDFITKASTGLTGVWSNSEGFPKARRLFFEGASDGARFKRWARLQQVPTLFWYSAYRDLNTARIRSNSRIRQGIANASTEAEARDWLTLFGSAPRPPATVSATEERRGTVDGPDSAPSEVLETGEIQAVFFGPLGGLERAEMVAVHIPDGLSRSKRKAWLEYVADETTFSDRLPVQKALMAAFGPDGLARLGLGGDSEHDPLNAFPLAFRQGMGSDFRSRILDDVGESAPEKWDWGSSRTPVDAMVVCYAYDPDILRKEVARLERRTKAAGMKIVARLPLAIRRNGKSDGKGRSPAIEHFGFADGVSQPIVKGTARAVSRNVAPMHLIAAGEFLYGYRDEYGYYPPTPAVRASSDRDGFLPKLENGDVSSTDCASGLRDFGRNGSFLVVRQLKQDVEAFNNYCASEAKRLTNATGDPAITPHWIAAKMIGRWPDGTSLVRNPEGRDRRSPDNDFSFGKEDPHGLRCPFGAHIRRSNPRDALGDDHETQIRIGKRHRILRIGRPYEKAEPKKGTEKGLLFMCLQADIERQYEFIQQTWVSSPSFHGLQSEKDPMIAAQNGESRFTIPSWEGGVVLKGIPSFVTTRGGGYFFLPSRAAMRYLISRL